MFLLNLVKGFGLKTWAYIAAFFTVVAIAARIYKAGGDAKTMEDLNNAIDAITRSDKIEDEVNSLSDDDVVDKLRDNGWFNKD